MTLTIKGEPLELVYSFRSNVYFEQMNGHAIDFTHLTANDLLSLFYCCVISSLQKQKRDIITMLDFLDIVDEAGGEACIMEFSNWYTEVMSKQYEIINSMMEDKKEDKKPKSSKKKKA